MMTVRDFKAELDKVDDNLVVIVEMAVEEKGEIVDRAELVSHIETNDTEFYLVAESENLVASKPLNEVLDEIRVEIGALPKTYPFVNHIDTYVKEDDVKKIIDRYKEGEE